MSGSFPAEKPRRELPKRPSAALPSSLVAQRTKKYASLLGMSGALHLDIFDQPHLSSDDCHSRMNGVRGQRIESKASKDRGSGSNRSKDRESQPGPFFVPAVQLLNIVCKFSRSSSLDPCALLCDLARILNEIPVSSTFFSGQANLFFLQARLTGEMKGKWCDEEDNANG